MLSAISRVGLRFAMVAVALTLSACGYNTIPTLEEQAKARWSDVQNQYQRRADLIPNLVATVQGYAAQEKSVLTSVIEARPRQHRSRSMPPISLTPHALAFNFPPLTGRVVDQANVMSAQSRIDLEAKLTDLENKSGGRHSEIAGRQRHRDLRQRTFS